MFLTGEHRIRAGVPKNWKVGDKTGTGAYGSTNDIAIIWPPHKRPILLVIYYTTTDKRAKMNESIIQQTAKLILQRLQ